MLTESFFFYFFHKRHINIIHGPHLNPLKISPWAGTCQANHCGVQSALKNLFPSTDQFSLWSAELDEIKVFQNDLKAKLFPLCLPSQLLWRLSALFFLLSSLLLTALWVQKVGFSFCEHSMKLRKAAMQNIIPSNHCIRHRRWCHIWYFHCKTFKETLYSSVLFVSKVQALNQSYESFPNFDPLEFTCIFPVKGKKAELWHHNAVKDLNLPGWWQPVQVPECGVSHRSSQARPRHINRISPLASWLARRALWPFEVTGPLTPLGEAWDLIPVLTPVRQDRNSHIFAFMQAHPHSKHIICSRSIIHP